MSRFIDADALQERLRVEFEREGTKADEMAMLGCGEASVKYNHGQFCYLNALELVKDAPTADVVEVRHGRWIKQKPDLEAMQIIHDMGLGKGLLLLRCKNGRRKERLLRKRKLKKRQACPECGSLFIDVWKTVERPVEHHCECRSCHYCGKTKRSARAAIKAWNRRADNGKS